MPKKDPIIFQRREFLNEAPMMSAFIIAVLEEFTLTKSRRNAYNFPTLDIGDCSEKVCLDFGFHDWEGMKKSQEKLAKFREIINQFADAFDSEVARVQKVRTEAIKKARKKTNVKTS